MKKTVLSIIAICALAAVSCQEIEPEFTATKTQTITLRAQIDPETKTTYGSDVTFGWSAGDAISLLVKNDILSIIIGGFAFCCLWGIHEMFLQEKRVLRGWFPENPLRHEYYERKRKEMEGKL